MKLIPLKQSSQIMVQKALILLLVLCNTQSFAQSANKYGLDIITDPKIFIELTQKDSNKKLVSIKEYIPNITLDIKYATTQNVFYTKLYDYPEALVRLPVVKALMKVENELNEKGYGLKIYDAYRPYSITCKMYEMLPDTLYMGLPWQGSKHNRGIALDLTLIDLKTKKELKMPTPYDALVYAAHPEFMKLPEETIMNRELLKATMKKYGFKVDPMEWWHYNYVSDQVFELLDIPFENLH
jgi:D-alanyl-D-alanine dipeptidase